jgi:adenylate cyclase
MTDFQRAQETISAWFLSDECRAMSLEDVLTQMGERLVALGFSVSRIATSLFTAHPEIHAQELIWTRGGTTVTRNHPHRLLESAEFLASPVAAVLGGESRIRCRLTEEKERARFPILSELYREGATDYVIRSVRFRDGRILGISYTSDRPGGLLEAEIEGLARLLPLAAMRLELESAVFTMTSLLSVYLGESAAQRVSQGAFRRGTGERIEAAIWFSDLRGFTTMADARPPEEVVATLDAHFDLVSRAISEHGGEILKFIGDAVLAIFPSSEGGVTAACRRAVAAAEQALMETERSHTAWAEGKPPVLDVGIGLHVGQVMFGNVGGQDRLDFTVIGAAVNVASRVASCCKGLDAALLFTRDVAAHLEGDRLVTRGQQTLRGVSGDVPLFTTKAAARTATS